MPRQFIEDGKWYYEHPNCNFNDAKHETVANHEMESHIIQQLNEMNKLLTGGKKR
jgi:hypothetical protein